MQLRPFSDPFTYRPGQPPAPQDWQSNENYNRAEQLAQTAANVGDFFASADNGPKDVDPRQGYVRLKNAEAPGLMERGTTTVSGYRTPAGDLQATGESDSFGPTTFDVAKGGAEIFVDRPWYANDRYLPTLETLDTNADGSKTYSMTYYNQSFNR